MQGWFSSLNRPQFKSGLNIVEQERQIHNAENIIQLKPISKLIGQILKQKSSPYSLFTAIPLR